MFCYSRSEAYVAHEYEHPHFSPESGLSAEELEKKVRTFFDAPAGLSPVMQRAQSFAVIMREARIEVNPHTPFADKIDLGIRYGTWAGPSFYERIYVQRYERIFSERIPQ